MTADPLLSVEHLSVAYASAKGVTQAVQDVSFSLGRNEVLGLAGESGSGKSTVAFAIARLHRPPAFITAGRITLDGVDVLGLAGEALRQWRWRGVSMVLQSAMNALNPLLTVQAQFADMFRVHGITGRREIRERSAELLRMVGLSPDRLADYPHRFSGGMRQRIVIALALALGPKLIIMDEPTTALDVVVQRELLEEVASLRRRLGFSILFITHDLALMSQFCDRIGIMLDGRLIETGTPDQLIAAPAHPYTRKLWQSLPPLHPREAPALALESTP